MNRMGGRARVRLGVSLAVLASSLLYLWTVETTRANLHLWGRKDDYYNLLVRGFAKGHLFMDVKPDPALLALPIRERPGYAPFLLDASLYQDRYYLYFGIAPALVVYLPYFLLTGQGFPEAGAALVFALAGMAFSILWWNEARKRFFPHLGALWGALSVLALSIGSGVLSTLRRPLFYEVAITSGFAFVMLSLWAFQKARDKNSLGPRWILIGSLSAGMAVASRANLALACLSLVGVGAIGSAHARYRGWPRSLIIGGLAFAGITAGLAIYNAARFGNPLEFGHTYQLGVEPQRLFHFTNFVRNAWIYYLRPPALNGYFPFVAPAAEPIKPLDYVGRETAHGEFVWLPIALAVLWALAGHVGKDRRIRDWAEMLAPPMIVFSVNFLVTSSVGVRANRYMLDFHPALVLAVVSGLGLWIASAPRLIQVSAGLAMLAAEVFNLLGSLQAQGLFRATDPTGYAHVAIVADRTVWPLLLKNPTVGDRKISIRWPDHPRPGAFEPIGSAGTSAYDDVIWVQYGLHDQVRLAYQYSELGRTFGRWFAFAPGSKAELDVTGALFLPHPGHPWYGQRPFLLQQVLKRELIVSVDGSEEFDRDVPSHDSSPALQNWGKWRDPDGGENSFSGSVLNVQGRPVDEGRGRRAMEASGPISLRLVFPEDCDGRYEPLLQSGDAKRFDTLVLHFVRPGQLQLVHDQLGSGARWSPVFAVDDSRPQHVVVALPFADDGLEWTSDGPRFRKSPTTRIEVRWNGRTVFEPEVQPASSTRPEVVVGANLLGSSVCQAMYDGTIELEASPEPLGEVVSGDFIHVGGSFRDLDSNAGILVRFDRDDGVSAAICWERVGALGRVRLGWVEGGSASWSAQTVAIASLSQLSGGISADDSPVGGVWSTSKRGSPGRLVVDLGSATPLAVRTDYFSRGGVNATASEPGIWEGSALLAKRRQRAGDDAKARLPGEIRMTVRIPNGRRMATSPLLEAGQVGAADSIYLRSLGDGRFVVGLDHWSVGYLESAPFAIEADAPATFTLSMASLNGEGAGNASQLRVELDGRVVLQRSTSFYPVRPGEVYYGSNPLGMSTSGRSFDGELVEIRVHQEQGPHPGS